MEYVIYCVSHGETRLSYTQGASATVVFEGNAVALYGNVNHDHGLFSVSIDGMNQPNFNGYSPESRYQMLLVSMSFVVCFPAI